MALPKTLSGAQADFLALNPMIGIATDGHLWLCRGEIQSLFLPFSPLPPAATTIPSHTPPFTYAFASDTLSENMN